MINKYKKDVFQDYVMTDTLIYKRFRKFQETLTENHIDAAFIDSKIHFSYLLGFKTESTSRLFVPSSHSNLSPFLITSPLELEIVKAKKPWKELDILVPQELMTSRTKESLRKKTVHKMSIKEQEIEVPDFIIEQEMALDFKRKLRSTLSTSSELNFPGMDIQSTITKAVEDGRLRIVDFNHQQVITDRRDDLGLLVDLMTENHVKYLGLEYDYLTYQTFLDLSNAYKTNTLDEIQTKDISELLRKQRIHKDSDEIDLIQSAAKIGDNAYQTAVKSIDLGLTELEVCADVEHTMKRSGSENPSFETIIVSGNNSAFPHGHPTNKKIIPGDLVTIDLGGIVQGYCSDMTRTVIAHSQLRPETVKILRTVNEAQRLAIKSLTLGGSWAEADKTVRKYFTSVNMLQYYNHSLGHGVGVEVHESPWINYRQVQSEKKLEKGMVFTIEPGLYIPGIGGARTEDMIVMTDNGVKLLTKSPILDY